jgi:hypothetical protein
MRDQQAEEESGLRDQDKRRPYAPPQIEHLGPMSELTGLDDGASGSDGPYGASAISG